MTESGSSYLLGKPEQVSGNRGGLGTAEQGLTTGEALKLLEKEAGIGCCQLFLLNVIAFIGAFFLLLLSFFFNMLCGYYAISNLLYDGKMPASELSTIHITIFYLAINLSCVSLFGSPMAAYLLGMKLISTHSLKPWCSPVGFAVHQVCEIFLSYTAAAAAADALRTARATTLATTPLADAADAAALALAAAALGWLLLFPCGCCGTPYQSWLNTQFSVMWVRSADYSKFMAVNEKRIRDLYLTIEQEQQFRRKEIFVDLGIVSDFGLGLYLAAAWTYCFVLTDLYLTDPFKAYAIFLSNPIVVGLTCDYILAVPPEVIGFRRGLGSLFFMCFFITCLPAYLVFEVDRGILAPSLRVGISIGAIATCLAAPFVLLLTCAGRDCARRDRDD